MGSIRTVFQFSESEPCRVGSINLYGYRSNTPYKGVFYYVVPALHAAGKLNRLYPDLNLSSACDDNWLFQQEQQVGKLFRIKRESLKPRTKIHLYKAEFTKGAPELPLRLDLRHLDPEEDITWLGSIKEQERKERVFIENCKLLRKVDATSLIKGKDLQVLIRTDKILVDLDNHLAYEKDDSPVIYQSYVCGDMGERYLQKEFVDAFLEELTDVVEEAA